MLSEPKKPTSETSDALVAPMAVPSTLVPADVERIAHYAAAARVKSTERTYAGAWRRFEEWCAGGRASLPATAESVAAYISYLADPVDRGGRGAKAASIDLALAAISQAHMLSGFPSPRADARLRRVRRGIRQTIRVEQDRKRPVLVTDLRTMVAALPPGLLGLRDRALLTLGFAGAFRRSELVALDVADLVFVEEGMEVTLRKSKTDQEGEGRKVGIPFGSRRSTTCPVSAMRAWLEATGIETGAVFRSVDRWGRVGDRLSDRGVVLVVKRYAAAAGLDVATLAGHSLRAGLATSAAKAGKSERSIMAQTGHRSTQMVRRYIRDASLFSDNAADGIGL
jgi:integrase